MNQTTFHKGGVTKSAQERIRMKLGIFEECREGVYTMIFILNFYL